MPETIRTMGAYTVEQLAPAVWAIDTDRDESLYLVCGSERAALIDTGSSPQPLGPVLRTLWQGPVELVLTHAHFDHMYHANAFGRVTLHEREAAAWGVLRAVAAAGVLGSGRCPRHYPVRAWHTVRQGDVIPLGGRELRVLDAPGHTPGSMILVDEADRLLFTGDAFGSGSYAWMWMPGCSCLSEYQRMLEGLIPQLEPYESFRMLGGHRRQGTPCEADRDARPLTLDTVRAMQALCEKILRGECAPQKTERNFGFTTQLYRAGPAAMVLRPGKIK